MTTSAEGIQIIKQFEGCVLSVYSDAVGVKTCGFGHTGSDVNALAVGTRITQAQADALLRKDLDKFEKHVMQYNPVYHWTQNQFDAMVSFAFNVGSITQLTSSGQRSKGEIAEKITAYNKAGGRVLPGLVKRREAERKLFVGEGAKATYPVLRKGSSGQYVKAVQLRLSDFGYLQKTQADGIWGPKTDEAFRAFQAERGLTVDGICGKMSWEELKKI